LVTKHLVFLLIRQKADLAKQLAELKGELLALRVQKIANGSAAKITRMFAASTFGQLV